MFQRKDLEEMEYLYEGYVYRNKSLDDRVLNEENLVHLPNNTKRNRLSQSMKVFVFYRIFSEEQLVVVVVVVEVVLVEDAHLVSHLLIKSNDFLFFYLALL